MWKQITVLAGAAALAVSMPLGALALTSEDVPTPTDPTAAEAVDYFANDLVAPGDEALVQDDALVRQQLRIHAETGPPEGFEPIQQRLHAQDHAGNPDAPMTPGTPPADGAPGGMFRGGNPDAPRDGTGECTNPDGPIGTGPHGPGAGATG